MKQFDGNALSWRTDGPVVEVELHHPPANEIGSAMLSDLESLADALPKLERRAAVLLWHSSVPAGFSAGAHLRELYRRMLDLPAEARVAGVRSFLLRIHRV
jgi:enoyl-CoA hydratase/carnithine racemase